MQIVATKLITCFKVQSYFLEWDWIPETPSSGRGAVSSGVHMALGFLTFLGEALHGIEAHEEVPKGIVAIKGIVVLRTMISWARR